MRGLSFVAANTCAITCIALATPLVLARLATSQMRGCHLMLACLRRTSVRELSTLATLSSQLLAALLLSSLRG